MTSSRGASAEASARGDLPPSVRASGPPRQREGTAELSVDWGETVLVETKLVAPPVRDQLVGRDHLLQRLSAGAERRLTLVACPAGFGKTSLLTAWYLAEAARRPVAWLTLDKDDNDSALLWSYLLEALGRVCPDVAQATQLRSPGGRPVVEVLLPRLVNALAEQAGVTLILDDFHLLADGRARETLNWLVEHAPPSFQLVLSTRKEPDIAVGALRAHGDLLELRADDLRFTVEEADTFLNSRQMLGLSSADVDLLVQRTGGWPAGLYLAALSLRRADDRHDLVARFGASNRHVIDFLEAEVLDAHDPDDRDFMVRCSVLERMSGPLCDAVLQRDGSVETLRRLSRSNLFLVPMDDQGGWYRFHPLFGQLLGVELERQLPGLGVELHSAAHSWHCAQGNTTEAFGHAIAAGMIAEAADLVATTWFHYVNTGRHETVLAWIERFPVDALDQDVRLLLALAWTESMSGQQVLAEGAIARVERLLDAGPTPVSDGFSSAEASLACLRGVFPWGDVRAAYDHALRALELEGPGSPWHPVACWAVALARLSRGEYAEADTLFVEVSSTSPGPGHWIVSCTALAYRSLIAGHAGRIEAQARLAEASLGMARAHGLENSTAGPSMALGLSLTARGRPIEALPILEQAVALAHFQAQPLVLVRALRYLADALTMLGRHDDARAANAEVSFILAACVDPAALAGEGVVPASQVHVRGVPINGQLTHREPAILRLLASDLSEADMARQLFVSHSTVHSHVKSIYRKLDVSSRADALARAEAAGFLVLAPRRQRSPLGENAW